MTKDTLETQRKHVFFPWTSQNKAVPLEIEDAEGVWVRLSNGEKVLDFGSSIFNANLGHAHQGMKEAVIRAARDVCVTHPSLVHKEKAKLGENLARITPGAPFKGLVKSFFCLGGAEANEHAIRIARLVTGRYKVVTRYRSYHGASLGSMAHSGDYRRIPAETWMPGIIRIPDPPPRGLGQAIDTVCLFEEAMEIEGPETIACVLLEGITGTNGVFVPQSTYWPRIRALCERHGILLIADEVLSGFGRTGKWFGVDHFGVTPDMMVMAKGITAGYAPLSAVVVSESIAKHFDEETMWCGLTNYGFPMLCAIANAAIGFYESERVIDNAEARGKELKELLYGLQQRCPYVAEVRSLGLLAAIDLCQTKEGRVPYIPYRAKGVEADKAKKLQQALLTAGVMCPVRFGTLILSPPLCIRSEELKEGIKKIEHTLNAFIPTTLS